MKIEIKHRYTVTVLFEAEATSVMITVQKAVEAGANLRGANLRGANLSGANFSDADLIGADLIGAKNIDQAKGLGAIRSDLWAVLLNAPLEVRALLQALKDGKVDGSFYTGQCACLVGTIANARHCSISELPASLAPDAQRPAERWFMAIKPGDTPDKSVIAKMTIAWIEEFQVALSAATAVQTVQVAKGK